MIGGWVAGVDVSGAQKPSACDWAKAKAAGVDFAFVKLSEGKDYRDKAASDHVKKIAAAGIPVGVYHVHRHRRPQHDASRVCADAGERVGRVRRLAADHLHGAKLLELPDAAGARG